ncbi:MAG TPA: nucleoside-diphosphate sugar epimerase/dehydratase [Geobacteraceae bacterium]|nr:nucleoside-diphosphate sugar epimerase/dehydratase [Geobacteraceae bacterium]
MQKYKQLIIFFCDVSLVCAALVLAFLLRFDFRVPVEERELLLDCLLIVAVLQPLTFVAVGFYRSIWRYASLQDAVAILKGVTLASALAVLAVLYMRHFTPIPRSIFILDWFLLFTMVSASRLAWRLYRENFILNRQSAGPRTLIVGAGEAGSLLLKEIRRQPVASYNVIGFVDDDPAKKGMNLHGVPVLGAIRELPEFIGNNGIEDVIIAMPSADRSVIRKVPEYCRRARVRFKTLPTLGELIDGAVSVSQVKDVEIEDLLGRDPVVLDKRGITGFLTGKRVMVSGAAGSIGSEICRQVANYSPMKLILFDNAETPLYHIEKDLASSFPGLAVIPVIGDIRDSAKVAAVFNEFTIDVVFHAAAYKHVPLMEYNPAEAVTNNIMGTRVMADAACRAGVEKFVMISTDKAVNPTSIMGASKRVAELYVQALAGKCGTRFATVRFGNVLGSNGSVIPMFREQLNNGGPLTVTDPEVKRYFMTIPEATQLVLQAGCLSRGGEIFVLDMGEPLSILKLAQELIRLSGLIPYEDIDITFTGLRPGEKLFEEIILEGEGIEPTAHEKIKVLSPAAHDPRKLEIEMERLFHHAKMSNIHGLMSSLRRLVPEFMPAYHFYSAPPPVFRRMRPDIFPAADPGMSASSAPHNVTRLKAVPSSKTSKSADSPPSP